VRIWRGWKKSWVKVNGRFDPFYVVGSFAARVGRNVRIQKKTNTDALRHALYYVGMIKSFKCNHTEKLFNDIDVKRFRSFSRKARIKLEMLSATVSLDGLKVPPGNRLEALKGDRKGQYSIRIDSQWRICFNWEDGNSYEVEIVDYH
jgi:proteic killer suppression protein